MALTDADRLQMTMLALQQHNVILKSVDIEITAMEATDFELKVKYGTDTEWTVYAITTDGLDNWIYTVTSGAFVELNPSATGPIYAYTGG